MLSGVRGVAHHTICGPSVHFCICMVSMYMYIYTYYVYINIYIYRYYTYAEMHRWYTCRIVTEHALGVSCVPYSVHAHARFARARIIYIDQHAHTRTHTQFPHCTRTMNSFTLLLRTHSSHTCRHHVHTHMHAHARVSTQLGRTLDTRNASAHTLHTHAHK